MAKVLIGLSSRTPVTIAPPVGPQAGVYPAASQPVKIISDEELFALFPNRPLALVGKPGHQQLVFLGHPEAAVKQ